MIIATTPKQINAFKYQLVVDENNCIVSINFLLGKKIVLKYKLEDGDNLESKDDLEGYIINILSRKLDSKSNNKTANSTFYKNVMGV